MLHALQITLCFLHVYVHSFAQGCARTLERYRLRNLILIFDQTSSSLKYKPYNNMVTAKATPTNSTTIISTLSLITPPVSPSVSLLALPVPVAIPECGCVAVCATSVSTATLPFTSRVTTDEKNVASPVVSIDDAVPTVVGTLLKVSVGTIERSLRGRSAKSA